jgi:hypothetical protein
MMSWPSMSASADSGLWSLYFTAQPEYDAMLFDDNTYVERLEELSPVLFDKSTAVEIIQSSPDSDRTTKTQFQDEDSLAEQLSKTSNPQLRIMYVFGLIAQ